MCSATAQNGWFEDVGPPKQWSLSLMVARVAAHELGHVLLRSRSHSKCGLMRSAYDRHDASFAPDDAYRLNARDREVVQGNLGIR
jgi:hypothetical protein